MKKALFLFLAASGSLAQAAVLDIQAGAASAVQEFLQSRPGTVSSESNEGDPRSEERVAARADVESTDLGGALIGHARATSGVGDPAPLTAANPEELALEAACFSIADAVSYLVTTSAEEARKIVLRRGELPTSGRVESLLSLSGAVLAWAVDSTISLESIEGQIGVTIVDSTGNSVFDSTLTLAPELENGIQVEGALRAQQVSLDELAELGVDEDSLAVLAEIEEAGRLLLFVIPEQSHRYEYNATPNSEFFLTARLDVRLRNAPGGTGIAVALGRPFAELAEFVAVGLPGVDGEKFQKAMNDAVVRARPGDQSDFDAARPRVCGAAGIEAVALLLPLLLMMLHKSGRK